MELPEEARESAEAMRRVVGDQIKALSELSDIISRHGKTLDISSPQLGEPRAAQARSLDMQPVASAVGAESPSSWSEPDARRTIEPEAPRPPAPFNESTLAPAASLGATPLRAFETTRRVTNGNGGGGRTELRPTPIARPEPLRPAVAAPPRPTVTPRPPARIAAPSIAPLPPSPPPAAVAPPPPPAFSPPPASFPAPPVAFTAPPPAFAAPTPPALAAPQEDERGWVSDLLRRASREEEVPVEHARIEMEPAPPHELNGAANGSMPAASTEPLNALSMDIARAIDHDASAELWERHRRGERNLFTRRLYTLQGQQTFDEIRKKYQRDEDFRSAVDRYIQDFEKLLAEVGRNSKDRNASNAYLTSDTGKVYTMLAHASGRFD
jgi:hypothetical protein